MYPASACLPSFPAFPDSKQDMFPKDDLRISLLL